MTKIIDKIVKSKYPPKQTNVTWIDTSVKPAITKSFINGNWEIVGGGGGSSDSEIFDEYIDATDQQRNTALANVSNQTANSTTGKMGYKVLDPTKTFAKQVTAENTIYEIRDVFDFGGTQETPVSVTLPAGSTLKFNGGLIKNCNLNADNIEIEAPLVKIFDNVAFSGNCINQEYKVEWFVDQYDSSYINNPTKDAAIQFNQMFASGVKKVSFNDSNRFYNINSTINIHGHVDIVSNFDSYKEYYENKDVYTTIYTRNKIVMIDYFYEDNNSSTLNIEGLNLRNAYEASDSDFVETKDIPIFYLHNKTALWGVRLNMNIVGSSSSITPSVAGITTATVESVILYNFTGVKIVAEYTYISMVSIKGIITRTYYGVVTNTDKSHVADNWFTDVVVNADTRCCYGLLLNDDGYDRVYGSHQSTECCNTNNNESYIRFKEGEFNGYVWDTNGTKNGISSQRNQYLSTGWYNKTVGRKIVSNANDQITNSRNYTINNILPAFSCENALNRAINNASCPNFFKDTNTNTFSFKARIYNSSTEEYGEEVDALTGMGDYYDIFCIHNLFGEFVVPNLDFGGSSMKSFKGYYKGKQSAKIKFILSFIFYESYNPGALWLYVYSKVGIASSMKITINNIEYYPDTSSMQSYALRWEKLLVANSNVVIEWERNISNNSYYEFPNIFIPNNTRSLVALTNTQLSNNIPSNITSNFNLPNTNIIFNSTYSEPCRFNGKKYVFLDGYTCALRRGTTANRPTNLATTDKGFQYYDTTLSKYICWNGTDWINLDGTPLS